MTIDPKTLDTAGRQDFVSRHIGPDDAEISQMTHLLGYSELDKMIDAVVPKAIRLKTPLATGDGETELATFSELRKLSRLNKVYKTYLGMGYADTITPPVILRNVFENPGWYTQYTPYQAEIAQGRLEALLNFQTLVSDLTGLPIANASLLDEATAAAEAMALCFAATGRDEGKAFFVSETCHPQSIALLKTRAEPLGIRVIVGNHRTFTFDTPIFASLVQYPATDGVIDDFQAFHDKVKSFGALTVVASDLLSLVTLTPPAQFGTDIAIGSAQRFGVPLGYGGPHAAFFATKDEHKRRIPGRIVGLSRDASGNKAIRLALQTREQHIRREKATSNICTAQVLLAVMASLYAVYHGPKGLKLITSRIHVLTCLLNEGLKRLGLPQTTTPFFDTLRLDLGAARANAVLTEALSREMNFRKIDSDSISLTLDETTTEKDVLSILKVFQRAINKDDKLPFGLTDLRKTVTSPLKDEHLRTDELLKQDVFNHYHSESEMLRYLHRLESKDLSLNTSMIPLGSCTMKLNATTEMMPVTLHGFSRLHPFVPADQALGYQAMLSQLDAWLAEITGFAGVSLQPNAGSQGEYTGLLVIRKYHQERGQTHRNICLIPASAHGTNPASAVMAGMTVVIVKCDASGNVDLNDLETKAAEHAQNLSCLMVTYPSTHGVFEEGIVSICQIVHKNGGQVYMDGANMNAQVGLCRPGDFGVDVCHLNLHKTFCIPHGGGGPGMGPIGVAGHLKAYLPTHPIVATGGTNPIGAVSAAPWGSASILTISYAYIRLMGSAGLAKATKVAILNANYIAKKLDPHYPVLYKGTQGLVAHECILDTRPLKTVAGIEVTDIAKRLMDYGFHAPTISFPVAGTIMIEPTESESLEELDRFCDAMIAIREEIKKVEKGQWPRTDNPLKNAPHTASALSIDEWAHPYSRTVAIFPATWLSEHKYWPSVSRIDDAYGDRNLICTCAGFDA